MDGNYIVAFLSGEIPTQQWGFCSGSIYGGTLGIIFHHMIRFPTFNAGSAV